MSRTTNTAGLALAFVAATGIGLFAIHSDGAASAPLASPEAVVTDAFNSGIKHLNSGDKAELKAATEKGAGIQKAVELSPNMYRAYNGLGYSYRKTGDNAKALENYDQALKISPDFADALEYRGEAYLGLNRTDEAKQTYLKLFGSDRAHADVLMKAMKAWVEKRHAEPAGLDPSALSAFEGWMRERAELADRTVNMARVSPQANWR
jgi:tetratricopeptide (TPR) repeat protein